MDKPNVILVYADQMRYDCMGISGNPILKTPGLNRLCGNGINFTSAYTSFPLCCPFRASLFTGKYSTSHGMMANHYPIPLGQEFLPQIMSDNGYKTAWIGKWHLNGGRKYDYVPREYRLGFKHFVGFTRGHEYLSPIYYRNDDRTPYKTKVYEPDLQTGQLLDFIRDSLREGKPFFAGIGYGLPHPPVIHAPDYIKHLFSPDEIPLSDNVPEEQKDEAKKFLAMYYGMVINVDYQMQRLLNELEYMGVLENTAIVFVSDHGEMAHEHGMMGKKIFYEASMHVPFAVHYPKMQGRAVDHIVDPSVDIMPTILELCGLPVPEGVEGRSLVRTMEGENDDTLRDYVLYQIPREAEGPERHPYAHRGLRTKDFVYVEIDAAPAYLFDLKKDPHERFNQIGNGSYYDTVDMLKAKLHQAMQEIGDDWNKEMIFPPPDFQTHEDGAEFNIQLNKIAVFEEARI